MLFLLGVLKIWRLTCPNPTLALSHLGYRASKLAGDARTRGQKATKAATREVVSWTMVLDGAFSWESCGLYKVMILWCLQRQLLKKIWVLEKGSWIYIPLEKFAIVVAAYMILRSTQPCLTALSEELHCQARVAVNWWPVTLAIWPKLLKLSNWRFRVMRWVLDCSQLWGRRPDLRHSKYE